MWNVDGEENEYKEVTRSWIVLLQKNIESELDDKS